MFGPILWKQATLSLYPSVFSVASMPWTSDIKDCVALCLLLVVLWSASLLSIQTGEILQLGVKLARMGVLRCILVSTFSGILE